MEISKLDLSKINPNRNQPRKNYDENSLKELADSIKNDGLLVPIMVRPQKDKYEIVQGERRYRASILAGMKKVDVVIRDDISDKEAFHLSVIENIQREQMTPIEEALAFQKYLEMGYKHQEIADKVSKSRSFVTTRLRLLGLLPNVQKMISEGKISEGHAKVLLSARNGIAKVIEVCNFVHQTDDPFEFIQMKFIAEFKNIEKISVNDVKNFLKEFTNLTVGSELYTIRALAESKQIKEETEKKLDTLKNKKNNHPYDDNLETSENVKKQIEISLDLLKNAENFRKLGVKYLIIALNSGAYFNNFTSEIIQEYFEGILNEKESTIKKWEVYKAIEEWQELLEKAKKDDLTFDEIIDIVTQHDLESEFCLY